MTTVRLRAALKIGDQPVEIGGADRVEDRPSAHRGKAARDS